MHDHCCQAVTCHYASVCVPTVDMQSSAVRQNPALLLWNHAVVLNPSCLFKNTEEQKMKTEDRERCYTTVKLFNVNWRLICAYTWPQLVYNHHCESDCVLSLKHFEWILIIHQKWYIYYKFSIWNNHCVDQIFTDGCMDLRQGIFSCL